MGEFDDALKQVRMQQARAAQRAERGAFLAAYFGPRSSVGDDFGYPILLPVTVPHTHRTLVNELTERLPEHAYFRRGVVLQPPVGGEVLIEESAGDAASAKAGRGESAAWTTKKADVGLTPLVHVYSSGSDYDDVDVFVTSDRRCFAGYYSSDPFESAGRFAQAAAALLLR